MGLTKNNYQDKFSRWHHKPVRDGSPSSNNGWIYSAYANKVFPQSLEKTKLKHCYEACLRLTNPLVIDRSPSQKNPPVSKDEIIGLVSLGLLDYEYLEDSHFNFCFDEFYFNRKLTLTDTLKAIKALYKIRKEHRNYVWQEEIREAYPLAFKLMPWDIYYVKKMFNKKVSLFETITFYLNFLFVAFKGSKSIKMLTYLQVSEVAPFLAKFMNKKKLYNKYFGPMHPLSMRIK